MSGPAFEARWGGDCAECGEPFEAGEMARYNDDDQVVGEDCCGHAYEWTPEDRWR